MQRAVPIVLAGLVAAAGAAPGAQDAVYRAPAAADWAALATQQVRHIYTDGRPLPEDPDPKFHGTSVGRWEADTLVVETVGFSPLTELARNVAHSGAMRIVEWGVEGMSPNYLSRRGWTKNTFTPGEQVTVVIRPLRDGSPGGMFVRATLADGTALTFSAQPVP